MSQNVKEADEALSILSPEETAEVHGGTVDLGHYANVHGPAEDKPDMSHA
jgi:hypothetical protein